MAKRIVAVPQSNNDHTPGYIYIASGRVDDSAVMKIGVSTNPIRRQKQIGIQIRYVRRVVDMHAAFRIEKRMRAFWLRRGCRALEGHIDWFRFDVDHYNDLIELFNSGEWERLNIPMSWREHVQAQRRKQRDADEFLRTWAIERSAMQREIEILHGRLDMLREAKKQRLQDIALGKIESDSVLRMKVYGAEFLVAAYQSGALKPGRLSREDA